MKVEYVVRNNGKIVERTEIIDPTLEELERKYMQYTAAGLTFDIVTMR